MKTLIVDNFDSFTYNLYQFCHELGANPEVHRNNQISVDDISPEKYSHIILSPGPGEPCNKRDFGICSEIIQKFSGLIPILGVCLGHQGIIHELGGKIVRAPLPVHGKQSCITIQNKHPLFRGLSEKIEVMRYHSLIGDKKTLPSELEVIAETSEDSLIMAVSHKDFPLYGVQFHPESIGTPEGKIILKNFLATKIIKKDEPYSMVEMKEVFDGMMDGYYTENEMEIILRSLADRGESADEILGAVLSMSEQAIPFLPAPDDGMDICGTGGSGLPRMNISTTAAFVLAACGVRIVKHGNKAASGRCGSFDLLEALGVNINLEGDRISKAVDKLGIGFLYASFFHPAMKVFMPIRRRIGIRTIFNILGPLLNPAKPSYQLLGTTDRNTAFKMATVLNKMNVKRAMVVTAENGLDEVTVAGKTYCFEVGNGLIREFTFQPEDIDIPSVSDFKDISSDGMAQNIENFHLLLQGKASEALQNLLLLNCAFALFIRGFSQDIQDGFAIAKETISSGQAYGKFLDYKHFSNL